MNEAGFGPRAGLVACMVLVVAIATPALAQMTTATLGGQVVDAEGNGLAGVVVVVTNARTGHARTSQTDDAGRYRIPALPPAPYKVEATRDGMFAPDTEIELRIGQEVALEIRMAPQKVEVVTVTANPILNVNETEVSTVVDPAHVAELPMVNRDFTDLANLAPGAKPKQSGQLDPTKNEAIYRPFTIGAGNGREVNIAIDGGDNNDASVGSYMMGLTVEAVQEFEVVTDQYKAEYGRASHGVVNVITKSGSNDLEVSAFGMYRDDSFRSKNFSEELAQTDKAESERKQYGFSLGGPLVRDRLFGFAAYERIEEEAPTSYPDALTGYDRTSSFAGQSFVTGPERDLYTAKLNWNVSPTNTAFLRYNADNNEFLNDQGGAETLEIYNGNSTNESWSALGNWTTVIGGNKINELQAHYVSFENGIASNTPGDSIDYITNETFDAGIPFTLGRNQNTPQRTVVDKLQLRDDFTWTIGDHDVKAGVDFVNVQFGDSLLGLPDGFTAAFQYQTGLDPDAIDADPTNLANIDEIAFANPGLIPSTDYNQIGLYLQDSWRANDRWTVYYGARYDMDDGVFDAQREGINRTFYETVASSTTPDRPVFGRVFPEDPKTFSPRAGFVYRLNGQDDDVLRGSWGIFHDKLIDNLTVFSTQNLSPVVYPSLPTLDCDGGQCVAGYDMDGAGPVAPLPADFTYENWADQASGLQAWNADNVGILGPLTTLDGQVLSMPSPDWEMPSTTSWSLGWGHRFNQDWAMDLTAIYADGDNQYRFWDVRGRNSGVVPATTAAQEVYFTTDGESEYTSLQGQLRAQKPKYSLIFNINFSRAEGAQDSGASADESGTQDIFSGGNRRFTGAAGNPYCNSATPFNPLFGNGSTGPICRDEFGPISGDQTVWSSLTMIYRLPLAFTVSGDVSYGSAIAFWPNAGYDQNNDGFNSGSEYVGSAGSGIGDEYFQMNLRGTKKFTFASDFALSVFAEVHNLTNSDNLGLYVNQRQAEADGTQNAFYGDPTGNQVGYSRTWNLGMRLTY